MCQGLKLSSGPLQLHDPAAHLWTQKAGKPNDSQEIGHEDGIGADEGEKIQDELQKCRGGSGNKEVP